MSKALVLRSLAELADYFPIEKVPPALPANGVDGAAAATSPVTWSASPIEPEETPLDLGALLTQIAQVSATVGGLTRQDQQAREAAHSLLERYEALGSEIHAAEQAWLQAQQVRHTAECLAADALAEAARAAAQALLPTALHAETAAARLVEQHRTAHDCLAAEPALSRLLEERRREAERQVAAAAVAEQTRLLGAGLAAVQTALAAGHLQEAEAMLGTLAKEHPDSAQITSLQSMIRQRVAAVKIDAAEEALREARRKYRPAPLDAITTLERVDLQELPEHLLQQIKGVWAAACARVCKERQATAFLRYLPQPAYGVIIAQEAAGEYRVISALGASHFQAGATVDETFVRRAQPLRARGR